MAVVFSRRCKRPRLLMIGPAELPWLSKVKYHGLTIDSKLAWSPHTQTVLKTVDIQLRRHGPIEPGNDRQVCEDYR